MNAMDSVVDLSPTRGRGWRIFSLIVLIGAGTFAAAYYLPLYRAHAALTDNYQRLSGEAKTQRKQLTDSLDTLKQVAAERDQLTIVAQEKQTASHDLVTQLDSLEKELRSQLKKFIGPGKLELERQKESLQFKLPSPALVSPTGGTLTEAGKSILCVVGAAAKATKLSVVVRAAASTEGAKPSSDWLTSSLRAGNAAQLLTGKCGLSSGDLDVRVTPQMGKSDATTLVVAIAPHSAG